jgi:uroporphyrinogen decarboxylase
MAEFRVPLARPKPDIDAFLAAMAGKRVPEKPPLEEYIVDNALMKPIIQEMLGRTWVETSDKQEFIGGQMDFSKESLASVNAWLDNQIAFWHRMGYDFVRVEVSLHLPAISHVVKDTAKGHEDHNRAWQGLEPGVITSWESFEKYPWPAVTDDSFYIHRYICDHLPDGLGFITCHAGGVYEHLSRLMGYEAVCLNLHDDPGLVKAVADRIGGIVKEYNARLLELEKLSAIFQGEDLGFNTQTLIPPDAIRSFILPWHKEFARMIHATGRQYFFHSCGRVDEIMDDLVNDVRIDGKHSFQDNVTPIGAYKKRWGSAIALLGGVDVDKLATYEPERLRAYVRAVIEECAPGGRYAVGAGNSVPSYIPVRNYLTMLDEALR